MSHWINNDPWPPRSTAMAQARARARGAKIRCSAMAGRETVGMHWNSKDSSKIIQTCQHNKALQQPMDPKMELHELRISARTIQYMVLQDFRRDVRQPLKMAAVRHFTDANRFVTPTLRVQIRIQQGLT